MGVGGRVAHSMSVNGDLPAGRSQWLVVEERQRGLLTDMVGGMGPRRRRWWLDVQFGQRRRRQMADRIGRYLAAFARMVALFIVVLWAISAQDGRNQIAAGLWMFPALIATTFVAYFGDVGPMSEPVLDYGIDVIVIVALALVTYWWAVKVGFRTDELDQVVRQQIQIGEEETKAAALA
jgi:hypothetical protein